MLSIDNKKLKVTKQEIFVGNIINNGLDGYDVGLTLEFINEDNVKGYLNLDVGYEKSNDINVFLNREYNGIPFFDDDQFIYFEVFDTEKFLDTEIESNIVIKFEDIKDNKVKVSFELNDELINIKYTGYLGIVNKLNNATN